MLANKRLDTGGLKAAPAIRSTLSSLSSHNLQLLSMVSDGNLQVKAPEAKPEPLLRVALSASVPRSYMRDEGRPLGAGLQEQAPNHLKLRW